jgi:hypothetical protein
MRDLVLLVALAACNVPATKFTPIGGGDGGGGTPAMLSASPTGDVALGTVIVGQTGATTGITVSNSGDQNSGAITLAFDDTTLGFTITGDNCSGNPLPGHQTCTFMLSLMPVSAAAVQTNLHITADPGGDVTKVVLGSGLLQGQIDITDMSYMYPNTGIAATAATKVFTVRNTGQAQVGAPVPSTSTGDAAYSVMSTTCTVPLNQTDTCTVTVAFKPTTVGSKAGSLVVTSTPGGSDVANLSGTGFAHVTVATNGGDGVGSVVSSPIGIQCSPNCAADFTQTPITLTATAGTESTFGGWSTDCSGNGVCTLDLTANKTATANFVLNSYTLTVSFVSNNPGGNTITSTPAGINCDGVNGCSSSFKVNSQVVLNANPDFNTGRFTIWNAGQCANSTATSCTFTMPSGGTSASATFDWFASLTIVKNAGDLGFTPTKSQASTSDSQINCTDTTNLLGTCFAHFSRNATVNILYQGVGTDWTSCKGGTGPKFLMTTALGSACHPPEGVICSTTSCVGSESCSMTFANAGDYTSEYDVACEM